ncbi:CDP-alcohol phosphatidyltransferase family protein [Georgenia sp. 10Sc9-8]|uniref:CDP-alcohol phosphatidyltransferase family protein n=1 Tax=Georgenia halotolerans TaxID=3028317 RepID=A0ABT5TV97_9MICO|nr:CDP-alcohol phosphatidyltransferase family protein [Georgenia halotolerans]
MRAAQKSNRGAPLYSRVVNRPLGRVFAAAAYRLGLTPNRVTMISAAFTFAGIAALATWSPSWTMAVATCLLLVVGYALDSADGQVARLRGGGSAAGEWLDHIFDAMKLATFHLAIAVSLYRFADLTSDLLLLVPLAFSAVSCVMFFAFILTDKLRAPRGPALASEDSDRPSILRSVLAAPTDYGFLCVVPLLLPVTVLFLAVYGVLLLGSAGYLTLALGKWYRDMQRV